MEHEAIETPETRRYPTSSAPALYRLSPSDFKYLWEQCKHCYYRKVIHNIRQPSIGMPGIFSRMNGMLQKYVLSKNLNELNSELPSGRFLFQEGWLRSTPIPPNGRSFISGRFDLLTAFDDGTSGVIDLKITDAKDEDLDKFDRQLHAYKFALENSEGGNARSAKNISRMGLLIISPSAVAIKDGNIYFKARPVWKEIRINPSSFLAFIKEVESVLSGPMPDPSPDCEWCRFRNT